MTEPMVQRTRDVIILVREHSMPVLVDTAMRTAGWPGGQGVQWAADSEDRFVVTFSDGMFGGFLLWGSDEDSDRLTAYTGNQPLYGFATMCIGTWVIATRNFERYTLQSRTGGGPLVENVYAPGQALYFSLRGLFTNQDEWAISGDPRAPNGFDLGNVVQAPSAANKYYLTVQTMM